MDSSFLTKTLIVFLVVSICSSVYAQTCVDKSLGELPFPLAHAEVGGVCKDDGPNYENEVSAGGTTSQIPNEEQLRILFQEAGYCDSVQGVKNLIGLYPFNLDLYENTFLYKNNHPDGHTFMIPFKVVEKICQGDKTTWQERCYIKSSEIETQGQIMAKVGNVFVWEKGSVSSCDLFYGFVMFWEIALKNSITP